MIRNYKTLWAIGLIGTLNLGTGACGGKTDDATGGTGEEGGEEEGTGGGEAGEASSAGTASSTSSGSGESGTSASTTGTGTSTGSTGSTGSTTGTTGSSSSTGGDTDSGGEGFITPPDGGVSNMCDPGKQDCANEDEKCTPFLMGTGCCVNSTHCVPVTGTRQFGESCTRDADSDDCDKGLFCMTRTSGQTGEGICMALCDVAATDPCPTGGTCNPFNDGVLPMCQERCNPLIQDCVDPLGCYPAFDGFVCAAPGYEEGSGNDGDSCEAIQTCQPGLACTAAASQETCTAASCCTPICEIGGDAICTGMEECVAWYAEGQAPPGYESVGACGIPA